MRLKRRKGDNTARMKRRRVNETQEETIKKKKLDNLRISAERNEQMLHHLFVS